MCLLTGLPRGIHVVKVIANDILDNLKETTLENNSASAALSSQAVNFPDVEVVSVSWSPMINWSFPVKILLSTGLRLPIRGLAPQKGFRVPLY